MLRRTFPTPRLMPVAIALSCFVLSGAPVSSQEPTGADRAAIGTALQAQTPLPQSIWLESLGVSAMTSGARRPQIGKSIDGNPLRLAKVTYPHGIGTHAHSRMTVNLKGGAQKFLSMVGIDDETNGQSAAIFRVEVDGRTLFDSGVLKAGETKLVSVPLEGAQRMVPTVTTENGNTGWAHADWAGAMLVLSPGQNSQPEAVDAAQLLPPERFYAVAPDAPQPALHGASLVGASPNRPFLYLVPATGRGPLSYEATPLPQGLSLNPKTGIISGRIAEAGTYQVKLTAKNSLGTASRVLEIQCGPNKLALTPPMGWNAWNVFGENVTADKVREQADWLIRSGLAARGYQYVMIDDTWQARRGDDGSIAPNRRFGDMKALADYLHARGLKLGIYSSPGTDTCSGFAGSGGHEEQDARTFASWGVDYLKYDWCGQSKGTEVKPEEVKAAYAKMRTALDKVDRDIVFAATTYAIGKPWEWGADAEVRANTWTTSAQILDRWDYLRDSAFKISETAKPSQGHWNDPGWLMFGKMGAMKPNFTRLTAAEQVTQMTMWSLLPAPLIISSDLRQLNPNNFYPITTSLLTNSDVLAVNQDSLGRPAERVHKNDDTEIWTRRLTDGTLAVGVLNKLNSPQEVGVYWHQLGLSGTLPVRDLWQRKDLGTTSAGYLAVLPAHGATLLKIGQPKPVS